MRKTLLMAGALLAMTATYSHAVGLELAWNHCYSQAGAVSLRTSACTSNIGLQAMYASFKPPAGVNKLEGLEAFVDFQVTGGVMPCWWNMTAGNAPRATALSVRPVSPADATTGLPTVLCANHYFFDNNGSGGGGMVVTGVDRGQLKGLVAIAAGTGLPVAADAQQYGMGFAISNANTTTCTGCLSSACLVLNTINLTSFGVPNVVLQSPSPGSENWITWQANALTTGCPGATPTTKSTWGSVKSLYR